MVYNVTVFEILIAGPSDVESERQVVSKVIEEWNRDNIDHVKMVLRPIMWESDSRPEMGGDAQSILNDQLTDRCDAIVAIFSIRLGTETPRAASGTVEEILRMHKAGKPVIVYFSRADIPRKHDPEQLALLEAFKSDLKQQGLTGDFATVDDLRDLARIHITDLAHGFRERMLETRVEQRGAAIGNEFTEADENLLRKIGMFILRATSPYVALSHLPSFTDEQTLTPNELSESLTVLERHGLIEPVLDQSDPYSPVQLTEAGFEAFLRSFVPNYDAQVQAILSAIIRDELGSAKEIATALGIPPQVVEHVLDRFHSQDLLQTAKYMSGVSILGYSPELRRHLERLEQQNASAVPPTAVAPVRVDSKACLALIDKGSISTDRARVTVEFLIRNEGDAPARDVSVQILNEAGEPRAGGGKSDVIVPDGDRPYHVSFSRQLSDVPGPEETRKFRIVIKFRDRHGWDTASYMLLVRGRNTNWRREIDPAETELSAACAYIQPPQV